MPPTWISTCVLVAGGGGSAVMEGAEWKGVTVEELQLSALVGHGYKWMAAASTVIYERCSQPKEARHILELQTAVYRPS